MKTLVTIRMTLEKTVEVLHPTWVNAEQVVKDLFHQGKIPVTAEEDFVMEDTLIAEGVDDIEIPTATQVVRVSTDVETEKI